MKIAITEFEGLTVDELKTKLVDGFSLAAKAILVKGDVSPVRDGEVHALEELKTTLEAEFDSVFRRLIDDGS